MISDKARRSPYRPTPKASTKGRQLNDRKTVHTDVCIAEQRKSSCVNSTIVHTGRRCERRASVRLRRTKTYTGKLSGMISEKERVLSVEDFSENLPQSSDHASGADSAMILEKPLQPKRFVMISN